MSESAEERGLLASIVEAPDEDVPRLIYADWLEDHGQPDQAEFIRGQIALTGMAADDAALLPQKRRSWVLERRLHEWIRRDIPRWVGIAGPMHLLADQPPHSIHPESECWRGFPISLAGDAHRLMTRGTLALERVPLRGLAIREIAEGADELGEWQGLSGLRALSLDLAGVSGTAAARLLSSARLSHLRTLVLRRPPSRTWNPEEFESMGRPGPLNGLTALVVEGGRAGAGTLAGLSAGGLASLRSLWLQRVQWGREPSCLWPHGNGWRRSTRWQWKAP